MSETIEKTCPRCGGSGEQSDGSCVRCGGHGNIVDVEATLRAELDAAQSDNARLRDVAEKQSRGRRAALAGLLRMARRKVPPGPVAPPVPLDVQAAHEREVSELYATIASVTAERDAAREEVERLRDIIRHNAPVAVGVCSPMVSAEIDKRDAEIARLTAEVDRMTAAYRYADDGHDENMRETARLIRENEQLTAQLREAASVMRAHLNGDATNRMRAAWLAGHKP